MRKILLLLIVVLVSACKPSAKKLYVHTSIVDGEIRKDTFHLVDSEYLEVGTASITAQDGSKKYVANKTLEESQLGQPFHYKEIVVVSEKDSIEYFPDGTAFLNYMSERNYELVTEKENKYGKDFTFKKK